MAHSLKIHRLFLALSAGLCLIGSAQASNFTSATYDGAKANLKTLYKAEREACAPMSGNTKDICVEEVKARDKISHAQLTYNYTGVDKDEQKLYQARYEATYAVAKEKCDDASGQAKSLCVREAKTVRDKAKADLKLTRKVVDAIDDAAASRMKADYKLAAEKCESMPMEGRQVCVATIKARYNERW